MINLGRNDPCHCGSGKKYKKCHLNVDQRHHAQMGQSDADSTSSSVRFDVKNLPILFGRLSRKGSAEDRKFFAKLTAESEPVIECLARQEEIEAASRELEAHRREFEKLARDEDRYAALAQEVFAQECFAPFRFTATEVQRAFDKVGHPALMSPDERTLETLRAAILHLADKERRSMLSMGLFSRLPDFVHAGRYMEGWLIQCAALDTVEDQEESNPFLFQMFASGYDAWSAEKHAKNEALLRTMGLDLDGLRGMSVSELDSWLQSQTSDPAKTGMLEAFFRDNPHLRDESVANLEAMERNSPKLLEREDSRFLLIPGEEVQPWLAVFNDRLSQSGFLSETPDAAPSRESVRRTFEELVLPLIREMAGAIFTRERILQLVAALREYRHDRFTAGDQKTVEHAMGAITYLEREDSPGVNSFLLALCWRSLDSAIQAGAAANDRHAEMPGSV